MPTEYRIDCLRDSLLGARDKRANQLMANRATEGWELVRFTPMQVLGTDVGLHLLFRRVDRRGAAPAQPHR